MHDPEVSQPLLGQFDVLEAPWRALACTTPR